MTSIINNIGNSFPAKLFPSAIKFKNACRKINFFQCKDHPVLKLNSACLMDFTCQYLLKLSLSPVMICFIHTWFTEPMSSSCRTIDSNSIVHTKFGYSLTKNSQYQCSHSQGKHDSSKFSILARSSTFPMKTGIGSSNNLRHCYTKLSSPLSVQLST